MTPSTTRTSAVDRAISGHAQHPRTELTPPLRHATLALDCLARDRRAQEAIHTHTLTHARTHERPFAVPSETSLPLAQALTSDAETGCHHLTRPPVPRPPPHGKEVYYRDCRRYVCSAAIPLQIKPALPEKPAAVAVASLPDATSHGVQSAPLAQLLISTEQDPPLLRLRRRCGRAASGCPSLSAEQPAVTAGVRVVELRAYCGRASFAR